jgi:hypothetical protein
MFTVGRHKVCAIVTFFCMRRSKGSTRETAGIPDAAAAIDMEGVTRKGAEHKWLRELADLMQGLANWYLTSPRPAARDRSQ